MKVKTAEFVTSAPDYEGCPESDRPEFAFIGRSNVGKSSLINLLAGKQGLAKVSSKPGKTALINFFNINDSWTLVDLPGYGYARRSAEEQEKFNEFVSDYAAQRPNLACLFLLIDGKIPPQKSDLLFLQWIVEHEIRFCLIFTKGDRVKPTQLKKNIEAFMTEAQHFVAGTPKTIACSAKTGRGQGEILQFVDEVIRAWKK